MNIKGSTLVLLVIVMAIIITLGVSILNIAMMQYDFKKLNTEIKQAFYMSETGLNVAYVDACGLLRKAVEDSLEKSEEYLQLYPLNESEAENIFIVNYKLYITANLENSVWRSTNPIVEITNGDTLLFIGDKLTAKVRSKYLSEYDIEKILYVDLIILVPEYSEILNTDYEMSDYIDFDNWS
ncbi:MAG: hypothetical protein WBJ13_05000 [Sedimentibacter sp.]